MGKTEFIKFSDENKMFKLMRLLRGAKIKILADCYSEPYTSLSKLGEEMRKMHF